MACYDITFIIYLYSSNGCQTSTIIATTYYLCLWRNHHQGVKAAYSSHGNVNVKAPNRVYYSHVQCHLIMILHPVNSRECIYLNIYRSNSDISSTTLVIIVGSNHTSSSGAQISYSTSLTHNSIYWNKTELNNKGKGMTLNKQLNNSFHVVHINRKSPLSERGENMGLDWERRMENVDK